MSGFFICALLGREVAKDISGGNQMADQTVANQTKVNEKKPTGLSLDSWAVAIALLLAALVRLGVLKHVAW